VSVFNEDIKNMDKLLFAMQNVETVFHFAANPDISKAVSKPDIDFWEGTFLTQNILEAMRIKGAKTIVYTSGSGVYGEDSSVEFSESHGPCHPISTYGASKLACEALICSYSHMFGIKGRVYRFANVVGPRQTHGVGYDFVRKLISNPKVLDILGDGSQTKSYIHVNDVVNAMISTLRLDEGKLYDVFNVATGDYISVTDIANLACEVLGLAPHGVEFKYSGGDRGWRGDVPSIKFNISKICKTGWIPSLGSKEALLSSIREMRSELIN
jgi:UDP-glucose 4-epimerase